jgi:restriction system protein
MRAAPETALEISDGQELGFFAVLLRSPWWVSLLVAALLALLAAAWLPDGYRTVGALSAMPFVVISAIAARRQWRLPSAKQIDQTLDALGTMGWPQFAAVLEQAFQRDGYTVTRGRSDAFDFELERQGRVMLVAARRWKSARTGLELLRSLQGAREHKEAADALLISLGELTANAKPFAAEHRIAVWQAAELAQALGSLPRKGPAAR